MKKKKLDNLPTKESLTNYKKKRKLTGYNPLSKVKPKKQKDLPDWTKNFEKEE